MVGKGFAAYSLMGYVIANMKPDKTVGFQVELNTVLLATIFGESKESIQAAIDFLCAPDPDSRTKTEDGRRLVQVGTFAYRVVNGVAYDKIRNEEDRREQNRIAQAKHRALKKPRKGNQVKKVVNGMAEYKSDERRALKALDAGDQDTYDKIAAGEA